MLSAFNQFIIAHLQPLVWALVATVMVVYGAHLNQQLRRVFKPLPWLLRIMAFVVACAVGYGWLSLLLVELMVSALAELRPLAILLVLLGGFLTVGVLAERRRMI